MGARAVQLVVRRWSTHGGTERYVHGLSHWLTKEGWRPTVWCVGQDGPAEGVDLRVLGPSGRGRMGHLLAGVLRSRRVEGAGLRVGFIRAPGFDVLRAGGGAHVESMKRLGKWGLADQLERRVDRRALASAGVVVANSHLGQAGILAESGRRQDVTPVVRNGVDLDAFRPCPLGREDRDALVFVGHGFARKGLATAIRSLVHLPGLTLRVVGQDRRAGRYRALADSLGVAGRVAFLGRVDDPAAVVARSRALLLPTRYDPSANVVLEALSCGVPPVTTRHDGAAEVVPMPWLVVDDPDDAIAVASAVARAIEEPGLRMGCRSAAEAWPLERSFREFATVLAHAEASALPQEVP